MFKDSLFKLIRSEEVVLWAGAGFSRYAGFPSGEELGKILFNSLSESEQKQINSQLLLPDLAEEIYRIKGCSKNSLIRILKRQFIEHTPTSTVYHDKLAAIPHIRTVITTNYDRLIENAYGQKGQVAITPRDIAYFEKGKVEIFKAHGDLSNPDSIILTKSDFNNFFKNDRESDIDWTVIRGRLATKIILFIGYNLEDPNVSVIFDKISEVLGPHRRECYFVSPNLPSSKINQLIKDNIHYINSTGETLIDELIVDIKANIKDDLENRITSADTVNDFLLNLNLAAKFEGGKDSYKLLSIDGIDGEVERVINISIKNDEEFIVGFNDFIQGHKFEDFEIPQEKLLKAEISIGGIKYIRLDSVSRLKLQSLPSVTTLIDICFEDGSEFTEIPVKVYRSKSLIEYHVTLKNAALIISLAPVSQAGSKIDYKYEHNEKCLKIKDEIEMFTLLNKFAVGQQFKIYTQSGETFSPKPSRLDPLLELSQFYLNYFENLKLIEQSYNVRFTNFDLQSITRETVGLVTLAVSVNKGKSFSINSDDEVQVGLSDLSELVLKQLNKIINERASIIAIYHKGEVEIHGQKIYLGYKKIEFLEPHILNHEAIFKKEEQIIRFISKKTIITYSRTGEF